MSTRMARICGPGCLAPKLTEIPSFGWMRMVMTLWWTSPGFRENRRLRSALEVDGNLGQLIGQPLAGTHIEGNSRPAPVVDVELDGNVRLGT